MTEKSYFNECCLVRSKSFKGVFSALQHTTILMSSINDGLCTRILVIIILFIRCWWKIVTKRKKKQKKKIHLLPSCVCEICKDKFMAAFRSREIVCRSKMINCLEYLHFQKPQAILFILKCASHGWYFPSANDLIIMHHALLWKKFLVGPSYTFQRKA